MWYVDTSWALASHQLVPGHCDLDLWFPCADPENFAGRGPTFTTFFFVFFLGDEGKVDPNTTISGPTSARQRNAI